MKKVNEFIYRFVMANSEIVKIILKERTSKLIYYKIPTVNT